MPGRAGPDHQRDEQYDCDHDRHAQGGGAGCVASTVSWGHELTSGLIARDRSSSSFTPLPNDGRCCVMTAIRTCCPLIRITPTLLTAHRPLSFSPGPFELSIASQPFLLAKSV